MTPDALAIRETILKIAHASGHGHIPTCFSVVEMLLAAYGVMHHDPAQPEWDGRDLFVLSKGHAALAHYCMLARLGYFPAEDVYAFGQFDSTFGCHADRHKVPGVEVSTGSLGHGIGVATGMALACRLAGTGRRVFTLIGDGESNEGTVWEAVSAATHLKLANLTILYDDNGSQVRCQPIPNPAQRLRAFGCDVVEADGHDEAALREAMATPGDNVRAVVARATKGYGCKTLCAEMFAWHRRSPDDDELAQLLEELHAGAVS